MRYDKILSLKMRDNGANVLKKDKSAGVASSFRIHYQLHNYDVAHITFCTLVGTLMQQ